MNWIKLGKIYCAENDNEFMKTAGRAPVPRWIEGDIFEIYFASQDAEMRGRIFKLTINITNPTKVIEITTDPIVDMGNVGFFDDNGIIPSCILDHDNKVFLYTIGFSLKNKILFDASCGLAIREDDKTEFKKFKGPIVDRGIDDPCFASSPYVIFDDSDNKFKMWYVSCDYWEDLHNGKYKHYYNVKYKESVDGIIWSQRSKVCIDYKNEYEYSISRPCVIKDGENDYKMWYSYRAQKNIDTNRMGYAESKDGINWSRKDELMSQLDVSEEGWDSEMITYPYVFDHKGERYMLYNGNGYGNSGFGIAKLEK